MKTLKTNRSNHRKVIFVFLFLSAPFREGHLWAEPFQVDPSNRHVFTSRGKPVSLFRTSHEAMFNWAGWDRDGGWHFNWSYKDRRRFVDDASSKKNNAVRLGINRHREVFRRTGPGTAHDGELKNDLTQKTGAGHVNGEAGIRFTAQTPSRSEGKTKCCSASTGLAMRADSSTKRFRTWTP